jgi:hypothetical protein
MTILRKIAIIAELQAEDEAAETPEQWFSTSGHDPSQGRSGSDVGSREGCLESRIITKKSKFVSEFKQNDRENAAGNVL